VRLRFAITGYFAFCLILSTLTIAAAVHGGSLGVGSEMFEPIYPEEYVFGERPQIVWQTVIDILASSPNSRIHFKDQDNLIVSWSEHLNASIEDRKNDVRDRNLDRAKRLYADEVREVGKGGVAFTTVCIRKQNTGSLIRIRRVYYGQLTQPRLAHSRGVFANLFCDLLRQKLGDVSYGKAP
jgi:hypothetical protein